MCLVTKQFFSANQLEKCESCLPLTCRKYSPGSGLKASRSLTTDTDWFVRTAQGQACDERWKVWPSIQDTAVASGNVLLWQMVPAVGNMFRSLATMMKVMCFFRFDCVCMCVPLKNTSEQRFVCQTIRPHKRTVHTCLPRDSLFVGVTAAGGCPRARL